MAKQKGIIKLEGTIGGITFFKTQDGYMAKEKTVISKERILNDPAFERTRENLSEFSRAGKATKLMRAAFHTQITAAKDNRLTGKLLQKMMRVLQADAGNVRGLRTVQAGELGFLHGFELNGKAALDQTLHAGIEPIINRNTGMVQLNVDPFTPKIAIKAAPGSTHCKLKIAAAEINFETEKFKTAEDESVIIPLNNLPHAGITLSAALTAGTVDPVMLLVGVEFFQNVNNVNYPLKTGDFNPLTVVKIDTL